MKMENEKETELINLLQSIYLSDTTKGILKYKDRIELKRLKNKYDLFETP